MGAAKRFVEGGMVGLLVAVTCGCAEPGGLVLTVRVHGVPPASDIQVTADGELVTYGDEGLVFERGYRSIAAARSSELISIVTAQNDTVIDTWFIGAGACERQCETSGDCANLDDAALVHEDVPVYVEEDGTFWGTNEDPRGWVERGCMLCEWEDGTGSATCT